MPSEAFFATTAQVLPAILIAFAIEAGLLLRDPMDGWRSRIRKTFGDMYRSLGEDDWRLFEDWMRRFAEGEVQQLRKQLLLVARIVLSMITVGEIRAVWALFVGAKNPTFVTTAGLVALLAMTFSTLIVATVPFVRLQLEVGR